MHGLQMSNIFAFSVTNDVVTNVRAHMLVVDHIRYSNSWQKQSNSNVNTFAHNSKRHEPLTLHVRTATRHRVAHCSLDCCCGRHHCRGPSHRIHITHSYALSNAHTTVHIHWASDARVFLCGIDIRQVNWFHSRSAPLRFAAASIQFQI